MMPQRLLIITLSALIAATIDTTPTHAWTTTTSPIASTSLSRNLCTNTPTTARQTSCSSRCSSRPSSRWTWTSLNVINQNGEPESATKTTSTSSTSVEETTEKYGLEAGLVESLQKDDGGQSAKDLLAKYGVAYLATSIPLAIVSFAICYALVDSGVDVAGLLGKVGIQVGDTGEKVGTFAIAYAAHKAASPIRFPPTVLLTPVVAKLIGKEPEGETETVE